MLRRRSDRTLIAGLVVTIFVILAASSVVIAQQNKALHRLESLARGAKATAADAKRASEQAAAGAADSRSLIEQFRPCAPGVPPSTPSCQRAAQADALVGRVLDALAHGLALHDANVHRDIDDLRHILASRSAPLPDRPPITSPASVVAAPTTTPPPPTTTTTCPKSGKSGRCR